MFSDGNKKMPEAMKRIGKSNYGGKFTGNDKQNKDIKVLWNFTYM